MVEPRVAEHVEHASRRAGLRVGRAEDDARHAPEHDRPGAHRARLEGDVEDRRGDAPASEPRRGLAQSEHLGVGGRVAAQLALIRSRGDHLALVGDHAADRHVVVLERALRFAQRCFLVSQARCGSRQRA